MPSQEIPDDDDVRQTYNFAPGSYGLVYRAYGGGEANDAEHEEQEQGGTRVSEQDSERKSDSKQAAKQSSAENELAPKYKLQAMKWGLVPCWTKRKPDYGSMMKTINCRDDSLAATGGMWNTMKQKKRCIIVAQGFYEWLKKDGGKKVPHFVKRKDGQLMCFAGLWDSVTFEERLYSYSIITTDVNKQLSFLHDRMPVILDNGSDDMFKWLDPQRNAWSKELQDLLKPYKGELDCYPVSGDVGKVGNNSPAFIVPVDSAENKQNIANFFGNQKPGDKSPAKETEKTPTKRPASPTSTSPPAKAQKTRPSRDKLTPISSKRSKSATSNETVAKAAPKPGETRKITSFFQK